MDQIRDAVALGLIQGVAEWLPISSSGHLLFARTFLGFRGSLGLDVFLHFASLCVILFFFRRDLFRVAAALFPVRRRSEEFRLALFIIVATCVTAAAGVLIKKFAGNLLEDPRLLGPAFLLTTAFLFSSRRQGAGSLSTPSSLLVGLSQAVALFPGVSRSGATLSVAKLLGIRPQDAFRFSFLIAVPAIVGAVVLERHEISSLPPAPLAAGFFTCLVVSSASLALLRRIVLRNRLHLFGWYTLLAGIVCLVLSFGR